MSQNNEEQYKKLLSRIEALMDAPENSEEEKELAFLAFVVEIYEDDILRNEEKECIHGHHFALRDSPKLPRDKIILCPFCLNGAVEDIVGEYGVGYVDGTKY